MNHSLIPQKNSRVIEQKPSLRTTDGRPRRAVRGDALVKAIECGISAKSDEAFFTNLATALSRTVGAEFAFIGTFADDGTRKIQVLGASRRGRRAGFDEYKLDGSPSEKLLAGRPYVVTRDVRKRYPKAHLLAAVGANSYVGMPLIGLDGTLLGAIVCLFTYPLRDPKRIRSIQKIFAGRAAVELVRMKESAAHKGVMSHLLGVLNISEDGIISVDDKQRVIVFNRGAERIFGYRSADIVGEPIDVLMPHRFRGRHGHYIEGFRQGDVSARTMGCRPQITGLHKDGQEIPLEAAISKHTVGGRSYMTIIMRDVSERAKTQEALHQAQKMEAIGQLTGGLAHDFNNLLMVILSNLVQLRGHIPNNDAAKRAFTRVEAAAERGAKLNSHLLAFARRQPLDPIPCDANKLVPGVIDMMGNLLGKSIKIKTILEPGLWYGLFDPAQVENSLFNLMINARDAMPNGGTLTIETANVVLGDAYSAKTPGAKTGPHVSIAVSDTGMGMPKSIVDRIFEPFFTTKAAGKGTGLGLSMVYGFVQQSGGHVRVESEVGKGTTILIYLPRTDDSAHANPDDPAVVTPPPQGHESKSILLVEDNSDIRDILAIFLTDFGYKVFSAADGLEALKILDDVKSIDLLLTDVMLPHNMNGGDIANEVSKRFPKAKILFTSGYTESALMQRVQLGKGAQLLVKPYTRAFLATRVREILEGA